MRKLAAILSSILLLSVLAGCGPDKPTQGPGSSSAPAGEPVPPAITASDAAAASAGSPGETVPAAASATPELTADASVTATPKPTANLQAESQQALDDLNQALKDLNEINDSSGDTGSAIDGLN